MNPEYVLKNFIIAVERMREAQKAFYATKAYEPAVKQQRFNEARSQEAQIDKAIEQGKKYLKTLQADPPLKS